MILTTCAACAAPLALDAPRCIRCRTRYLGRPEADLARGLALSFLAIGLSEGNHIEDALSAYEARL